MLTERLLEVKCVSPGRSVKSVAIYTLYFQEITKCDLDEDKGSMTHWVQWVRGLPLQDLKEICGANVMSLAQIGKESSCTQEL